MLLTISPKINFFLYCAGFGGISKAVVLKKVHLLDFSNFILVSCISLCSWLGTQTVSKGLHVVVKNSASASLFGELHLNQPCKEVKAERARRNEMVGGTEHQPLRCNSGCRAGAGARLCVSIVVGAGKRSGGNVSTLCWLEDQLVNHHVSVSQLQLKMRGCVRERGMDLTDGPLGG